MILSNDTLCVKISIGYVALESVPLAVLRNLLFADDDLYVIADFKIETLLELISHRYHGEALVLATVEQRV